MIEKTDLAYIAGLFDGEGSVNFTRRLEKKKKRTKESLSYLVYPDGDGYD